MSRRIPLSSAEIESRLQELPGWAYETNALECWFVFADFSQAFGFMTRAALAQEKYDHHAEWWNVYNRVKVRLNTHDAGGVTELDFTLAKLLDAAAVGASKPV